MQGRALLPHAQYDTASALGLFQPECIAGGGVLRKCRGDYSIDLRNRQPAAEEEEIAYVIGTFTYCLPVGTRKGA